MHVRVNRGSREDLEAVLGPGLSAVRAPKTESAAEIEEIAARLDAAGSPAVIFPVLESAAGVAACLAIASAPRVARVVFGANDFLADIGAPGDIDGPATHLARGTMVLQSRIAGIGAPVDAVFPALDDEAGLRRGAQAARALGFVGKSVIHPRQLGPVHEVFSPSEAELRRARQVIAADGQGAVALDGQFIDPAIVARARATIALSREEGGA
jgi:citrate lyase subunit beta/citryl-CoA lyase